MVWTAIGLALACVPFVGWGARSLSEFRGNLAGYWYQVTYDPGDGKLAEPCYSIEFMRLRHRGDTVKGTWWRIYPDDFEKKWTWKGQVEGSFVIGSYFASKRSKAGGSGNFFMMEIGEGRVKGHFMCVVIDDMASGGVGVEPRMWPMEWLRADRCTGALLTAWIKSLAIRPCMCAGPSRPREKGHPAVDHLPWYARRALGHSGWPNARKETEAGLAYVGAASAPLPALVHEAARREAAEIAARQPIPEIPLLQRVDILGEEFIHPRTKVAAAQLPDTAG